MPYLIDGHNLIGQLPDIQLADPDDEERLIEKLLEFCAKTGKRVEVFFDNAAPGHTGLTRRGLLTVHFSSAHSSADEAIRRRLARIGKTGPNWTVVSSDHFVQSKAREARAVVKPAAEFAVELQKSLNDAKGDRRIAPNAPADEKEIQQWLRLFGEVDEGE